MSLLLSLFPGKRWATFAPRRSRGAVGGAASGGRPTSSTGADTEEAEAADTEGADTTTDMAAVVDTGEVDTATVVMADTEEEADTGAGPCEGADPDTPIGARGRTGGADREEEEEEDTVGEVGGVVSGLWSSDWLN